MVAACTVLLDGRGTSHGQETTLPLTVIKGEFRIIGAAPDGDSVRFYPSADRAFERAGLPVRTNQAGGAQLRLEGIDSLETHYSAQVGNLGVLHQPLAHAHAAADRLLTLLGFTDVERNDNETVTSATPANTPGYIFTRFADTFGRCVAFAFPGQIDHDDLAPRFVEPADLATSANLDVLAAGLAYPTYYSMLFPDLRAALTETVIAARAAGVGLWPEDVTQTGVTVEGLDTLTEVAVILPKLFRRLVDYLAINDGDPSLAGLPAYLAMRDDRLFVVSRGAATGFDNVIEVDGQRVLLQHPPEDLVFIER